MATPALTATESVSHAAKLSSCGRALLPSPEALKSLGAQMHALAADLFPIPRSLTGDGVRETLRRLSQRIPITSHEVPTGTVAFDWEVPREWRVREAYIRAPNGEKVVDFRDSNLHLIHHSAPFRGTMTLEELQPHLHSLPDQPDLFSFRASYYNEVWGFCLAHSKRMQLQPGRYEVVVDTDLFPGHLTYGETVIPGDSDEEVLISAHLCHPSLANDNLSGLAVATFLAEALLALPRRRYTYRFVFAPATLGALIWLSRHEDQLSRIQHGLILALLGDPGQSTYKRSRLGNAPVDAMAAHVLTTAGSPCEIRDFVPFGYDERQYNAPGFDLPMGCLMRTPNGEFDQYHTNADNLDFITPAALADSLGKALAIVDGLERNGRYLNLSPKGEPKLGKRGLYQGTAHKWIPSDSDMALLWVLSYSDGDHSLLDIAVKAKLPFAAIADAAEQLLGVHLIRALTRDSQEKLGRAGLEKSIGLKVSLP